MNRAVVCGIVAVVYLLVSRGVVTIPAIQPVVPAPVVVPVDIPVPGLRPFAQTMSKEDKQALSIAYLTLANSVSANPLAEPVYATTGAVRAAHRAAIQVVWRGAMNHEPGKYPGLREALESALAERIGMDDIPLNPTKQSQAANAFADISKSFQ